MRRLVLFLAAMVLLAAPAIAQQAPKTLGAKAAVAKGAEPFPPLLPPPMAGPSLPPRSPLPGAAAADAQAQCSAQCSRTYYTCLAGDNADACSADWAQCRVSCGNAARRPASVGGLPGR
jgi:hypothetical protein